MSTLWWLTVLALAVPFAFLAGYVVRSEIERYYRNVYDVDFTRNRIGT